jgi:hypothetical protein
VDGLVAGGAGHEGLPAHGGHELGPRGLWPSRPGEVGEFADLVDFHPGTLVAPLAPPGAEPDDQLPAAGGRGGLAVGEDRLSLPFERDAAEPGDQWFLPARSTLASKQVRSPCGVTVLALYLRAIFVTVEPCRRLAF